MHSVGHAVSVYLLSAEL